MALRHDGSSASYPQRGMGAFMRWLLVTAMFLLFAGTIAMVQAEVDGAAALDGTPDCIEYRGEARYGAYGYNHFVIIRNGCDRDAKCTVTTDVNDDTHRVTVPKGQTKEVTTFIGSPASDFKPHVTCTLQ
jgi:hypothetical protein